MCLSLTFIHVYILLDFDGDDMIGVGDLREIISRLVGDEPLGNSLPAGQRVGEAARQRLIQAVLEEADLDDDGALSFAEFEHIIDNSPDFLRYLLYNINQLLNSY